VRLAALEEEDGHLPQVEVDEMPCLVGHVGAKVSAHDAVPGGVVLFVKLLLDVGRNVLLNVVLFQSLGGAIDGVLLHLLRHVGVLDHGFPVRHLEKIGFSFLPLL